MVYHWQKMQNLFAGGWYCSVDMKQVKLFSYSALALKKLSTSDT
jgi:hypothetical protein